MDEKELWHLISLFETSSLNVMEIEKNQEMFRIRLEKGGLPQGRAGQENGIARPLSAAITEAEDKSEAEQVKKESVYEPIKAPLVGIFYEAPAPGEEPFVKLGQKVEKGQTLCLLEAMKMMNELKAPVDGMIRRIGAENGDMVEFGQILYEVEPC